MCFTYVFKNSNNFCAVARTSSFVPALSKDIAEIIPCGSMKEAREKAAALNAEYKSQNVFQII
jgi:hypothetical protein